MLPAMSTFPIEIHLRSQQQVLEITWNDHHVSRLHLAYLRGFCPCAGCQGHFAKELKFVRGASTTLTDVQPVGSYAVRPVWGDGHQTGLYAYEFLRQIEREPPGPGPSNADVIADPSVAL